MPQTVLVVDDDAPVRRMLARTLEAEGEKVIAAADGGQALLAVERSVPDVVVLDVAMPGLDGLAVCRRLRAKGIAVPILLLTARDAVSDRVAGLDAGADDYLVKPFAPEELSARVRALGPAASPSASGWPWASSRSIPTLARRVEAGARSSSPGARPTSSRCSCATRGR